MLRVCVGVRTNAFQKAILNDGEKVFSFFSSSKAICNVMVMMMLPLFDFSKMSG